MCCFYHSTWTSALSRVFLCALRPSNNNKQGRLLNAVNVSDTSTWRRCKLQTERHLTVKRHFCPLVEKISTLNVVQFRLNVTFTDELLPLNESNLSGHRSCHRRHASVTARAARGSDRRLHRPDCCRRLHSEAKDWFFRGYKGWCTIFQSGWSLDGADLSNNAAAEPQWITAIVFHITGVYSVVFFVEALLKKRTGVCNCSWVWMGSVLHSSVE